MQRLPNLRRRFCLLVRYWYWYVRLTRDLRYGMRLSLILFLLDYHTRSHGIAAAGVAVCENGYK